MGSISRTDDRRACVHSANAVLEWLLAISIDGAPTKGSLEVPSMVLVLSNIAASVIIG